METSRACWRGSSLSVRLEDHYVIYRQLERDRHKRAIKHTPYRPFEDSMFPCASHDRSPRGRGLERGFHPLESASRVDDRRSAPSSRPRSRNRGMARRIDSGSRFARASRTRFEGGGNGERAAINGAAERTRVITPAIIKRRNAFCFNIESNLDRGGHEVLDAG